METYEFKQHFRFDEIRGDYPEDDVFKRYGVGGTSFLGAPSFFHNMLLITAD